MFKTFESSLHKLYSFEIKYKNQSLFMKLLGLLLFFNRKFMTRFTTTIGNTIYFPSEEFVKQNEQNSIEILSHELVHIQQAKKYGSFLFGLMYLFPQCLAVLALLAPISLWFLLALAFLLPIPAPWRAAFEEGGYTMSLFVLNEQYKFFKNPPEKIPELLAAAAYKIDNTYFKGSAYWFMWPFGSNVSDKIKYIENDVIVGTDEIYNCVRQSYWNAVSTYEL